MKLLLVLCGAALMAQTTLTTIQSTDQVSASRDVINANFAALLSKHLQGNGAPTGVAPCSISQNRGVIYSRLDAGAANASLYHCSNNGSGTYTWELVQGSGGGGGGNMIGANNLSELTSASTARNNLGLGTIATFASSAFEPAIAAGSTAQYLRGNKTLATLDTAVVPENGNLYYTAARVHSTLGGTTPLGIPIANGSSFSLVTLVSCSTSQKTNFRSGAFVCDTDLNSGGGGGGAWGGITGALADQTDLQAALNLKANLASPALSGVPTAPTAAPGTNTTQLATTAFVAALGALKSDIASPTFTGSPRVPTATPATNSTIAASTAYVDALGALKADLASPTLTGDPKAPTAAAADNDTSIATTAQVQAAIDAKTLAIGSGNAYKYGRIGSDGATLEWTAVKQVAPITITNAPSTIVAGGCTTRDVPNGGYFDSVEIRSIDSVGAALSGSITVQFSTSDAAGAPSWTTIGSVSLSSAANAVDSTLTGWTRTVVTGKVIRACVTAATTVQHVVISPRFL